MKQGRHGSGRKSPLEAQQHIDEDGAERDQHRKTALLGQLLAHLRADELDAAEIDFPIRRRTQRAQHLFAQLGLAYVCARRESNQDVARRAVVLHDRFIETGLTERGAHLLDIYRLGIAHLDHGAAGEVDAERKAPKGDREDRYQEQHARNRQGNLASAHEVVVRVSEYLHDGLYELLYQIGSASMRRCP